MISAGDFRNGLCFEMDDQVYQVVEFQHVKPGKGAAFVRTKYKNVKTGSVVERSFNPNEKFEQAQLTRQDMQYIYSDGDLYYFMDQETYEQTPIHQDKIGDGIKFLKEEMVCKVVSYKGDIFQVELPITVVLEITECEPGVKGDTANNASKYATLETGAVVKVPLFVNQGEKIKVDTRTGEYLERA
ncbi:MAG: elongation factor P [Eubacteriales bacterium]|jgi:elongation factor P|nr:elongation factor P [Oscillospiraceae bacterium]MBQ1247207.1 elongation factor P [Clostridiales bacterium]MDO4420667.1 elongation factor P [Eubacteriales bacterium]MBQ1571593.1 elongation factor P [Clostridiales bacterium]MBQ5768092.1 elongation factor P [Clostridiales bacterium]